MTLSKLWTNYSVALPGPTYVNGITDLALNVGLATMVEAGDGNVFATFGSLQRGAPTIRFTTLDLTTALGQLGATSLAIATALTVYFRRITKGGTRDAAGAGTHVSVALSTGIAVPRRISARSGENARLEVEIIATKDDGTSPLTVSAAASLPGNAAGPTATWTVGPVELAHSSSGAVLDGLESVDVDFGVGTHADARDSDVFPSFACVLGQRPSVRVSGAHIDAIAAAALSVDGKYYTASNVVVYFRKRAEGGTFVADGTAEHIKITLGKCRVEVQSISGDPKTAEILITPWQDLGGSVNPIAVSAASAIS